MHNRESFTDCTTLIALIELLIQLALNFKNVIRHIDFASNFQLKNF